MLCSVEQTVESFSFQHDNLELVLKYADQFAYWLGKFPYSSASFPPTQRRVASGIFSFLKFDVSLTHDVDDAQRVHDRFHHLLRDAGQLVVLDAERLERVEVLEDERRQHLDTAMRQREETRNEGSEK